MGLIYRKEQQINGYECTFNYKMQPTAAQNYFQQTSQEQSCALGVGPEKMEELGMAWFLVKYHIRFHNYPLYNTLVDVETEAMAFDKFAAHRRFAICSKDGEKMVEADTEWMLLNREENRLERLSNVPHVDVYGAGTKSSFKLRRLSEPPAWTEMKCFQVRYLDIDFNHHVNHVKYLAWAIETLPLDTVKHSELKSAKMIYKNQGFYGDTITVKCAAIQKHCFRMDIENQGGTLLCQLELEMETDEGGDA